jgi:catechol 2,3-dioxygenase-like lactoylglutathione lyase family enzyme
MVRLGHFAIPVRDLARSREWYVSNFGFEVEIDVPERRTVGLKDDGDQTLFLHETAEEIAPSCTFALEVADVEAKHRELAAKGIEFEKTPQKLFWGYGAELRDPDGYLVSVWDERSMREKGGS